MSKHTQTTTEALESMAEDARALMAATADVASDKVVAARKRLAAALDHSKDLCGDVRDKVLDEARAADKSVRANPYETIGIALGVGAVVGFLVSHRCACGCKKS